jgi:RimJ/RimL family protein N-acetyltransferase
MPIAFVSPPEEILTKDLVIRRYRREDALALHESITTSTDHLRPWMAWVKFEPQTIDQRQDLIDEWNSHWREGTDFTMGVFQKGEFVGGTGLHFRGDIDVVEIGYWIDVRYIRRGFAQQIVEALTVSAFSQWAHITRVEVRVDINNKKSSAVAERSGFTLDGRSERSPLAPGEQGVLLHWIKRRNANG